MADLKIKVGASVDRNLAQAFQPLIEAANKAAAAIAAAGLKGGRGTSAGTNTGVAQAAKGYDKLAAAANKSAAAQAKAAEKAAAAETRVTERAARDKIRAAENVAKAREKAEQVATAAAERGAAARARAHEREGKAQLQNAARDRSNQLQLARGAVTSASRAVGRVAGVGMRVGRAAIGVRNDIARGMGVDTDLTSIVAKNASLETTAAKVSNVGFMPSDLRNSQRVDSRALSEQALKVGASTGTDANVALEGLDRFVAKTGDLQTGRDLLMQMATLSKATGASLEDMMNASGDVANSLGDVEHKGELINQVMRAATAQGKLGAVEIKDLAKQMAKIATMAPMFHGERADMIAQMGALVQGARHSGGAASASQAATSLGSFVNVFNKQSRLKAFAAHGVEVYGKDNKVRAPIEVIKDALIASKGDPREMHKMFMDVGSQRITRPFETAFNNAGGGAAGLAAVQKAFDELKDATLGDAEVAESFARAMKQSQSQAESFNQQIRMNVMTMTTALTPALVQMAASAAGAAQKLAGIVSWIAGDRQGADASALVKADVPAAIKSTDIQLKGGKISEAQKIANKIAEAEARENFARASAEERQAREEAEAKTNNPTLNDKARRKFDAVMGTDTSGEKASAEGVAKKKAAMEEARKSFQDMLQENAKVSELLRQGIVVTVKNPTPPGPSPLSTPAGGVEPPPGER